MYLIIAAILNSRDFVAKASGGKSHMWHESRQIARSNLYNKPNYILYFLEGQ